MARAFICLINYTISHPRIFSNGIMRRCLGVRRLKIMKRKIHNSRIIFCLFTILMLINLNLLAQTNFTLGSTREDVRSIQGDPDNIRKGLGSEIWTYGLSTIEFQNGRVTEWSDYSHNLKIELKPGKNVTDSQSFTRGSHKDDVLRLQGTPDNIRKGLGSEIWTYGLSTIEFQNGRVTEWSDYSHNLKIELKPGKNVTDSQSFTRGSHKDDVLRLQGTPDNIRKGLGSEIWTYGLSTIEFQNNRVVEWGDYNNNLKIELKPGENVTSSQSFTRGSHKDDVIRLQGTPNNIKRFNALGYEVWDYDDNRIHISLLNDIVIDMSSDQEDKSSEDLLKYHHRFGDVNLYYDENKAYKGVFSFEDEELGDIYGMTREGVTYFYDQHFNPLEVISYFTSEKELMVVPLQESFNERMISDLSSKLSNITLTGDAIASGTALQFDDMTIYNLLTNFGTSLYGTSIDFDDLSFDNFYSSTGSSISGNRIRIGNISFGNWMTSEGETISGTSHRLGNTIFHNYRGPGGSLLTGTTIEIGDFSFTNYNEWKYDRY
jgi:hypothetical protein